MIRAIDDERNDIYIHFDRKVAHCPDCRTLHAGLMVLTERIDVRWGDVSVVRAEYALFDAAYRHGGYRYYHLLSGVDMPLKSQDYIHRFFEDNDGKEFIGYYQGDITTEINRKVRRWHLFPESFKKTGSMTAVGKQVLRAGFIRLQQMTGFHRNKTIDFREGHSMGEPYCGLYRLFTSI
ncbi:beta-1,6-N-acetylglucosaminyltransferase [Bacteroides thetaiotaomicron]|nr:beta-1,6-N-acetylglucosaminyltransferase [Bacteroides thetaiotaomicron]